jgi:TonB family protein
LQVTVKTDGLAYDAAVLESPGEAYSERALQAVKGWKFRPAHDKDGNPVSVRASIEVRFRRLR